MTIMMRDHIVIWVTLQMSTPKCDIGGKKLNFEKLSQTLLYDRVNTYWNVAKKSSKRYELGWEL